LERRSGSRLEIGLEKHGVLVDVDPPFSVMHRIGWLGMNEGAGGDELGTLSVVSCSAAAGGGKT
jgi:hypothetical protein